MDNGRTENQDLDMMQEALERACTALDIQPKDQSNRRRIAFLVAGSTRAGIHDLETLTSSVIERFKTQI